MHKLRRYDAGRFGPCGSAPAIRRLRRRRRVLHHSWGRADL